MKNLLSALVFLTCFNLHLQQTAGREKVSKNMK